MNIGKAKNNYNKYGKSKYFNYNIYKYIVKNCRKLKKEKKTRKCHKCDKVKYHAKNHRSEQKIKNKSIQKELDNNNKEVGFVKGLE